MSWKQSNCFHTFVVKLKYTYFNPKFSNSEVSKHLLVNQGDVERSKIFGVTVGPVLLTLDFLILLDVGYHDDSVYLFLPYHPPVISQCRTEWTCVRVSE